MPDPDLFDLDSAFASLQRDVAGVTHSPGAAAAVARAHRRRRTTIAAAAAVAVIAVGSVAVLQGVGHHSSAIEPADGGLPRPAALTPAALSAATTGWVDGWATPADANSFTGGQLDHLTCFNSMSEPPKPDHRGAAIFTTPGGGAGYLIALRYDQVAQADTAGRVIDSALSACHPTTTAPTTYAGGGTATFYEVPGVKGAGDVALWSAHLDGGVVFLALAGAHHTPTPDTMGRVDDALMSALQVDSTFTVQVGGGVSSSSSSVTSSSGATTATFDPPSEQQLTAAFAGWDSGLATGGTSTKIPTTPCTTDPSIGASVSSQVSSVGSNGGEFTYGFGTSTGAQQALQGLVSMWQACTATSYDVSQVEVTGRAPVTVATTGGAHPATVWAVQSGQYVTVLAIDGGSHPPDQVSAAVGGLLNDVLAHPQAPTTPPDPQQQGGGSSSSSGSASASAAPAG